MTLDVEKVLAWRFEEIKNAYSARDAMLYALGIGLSRDPCDEEELRFTAAAAPKVLPTIAAVIARPRPWIQEVGIDVKAGLHAAQAMQFHAPLAPAAKVRAEFRIERIVDKGSGRGAFIVLLQEISDDVSGARLCTLRWTNFVRAGGGFGGDPHGLPEAPQRPGRAADAIVDFPTDPRAPLIYRLCGDMNPLHADPAVARAAGFERPIMHGFCTFGIAGWLLIKTLCDHDPRRLAAIEARFSAPLYPGETFRLSIWRDGEEVRFEGASAERGVVVLSGGGANLRR